MTRIPALTLWRPWPELILHHGKDVENRDWSTAYRGPLLIHAGRTYDDHADWSCELTAPPITGRSAQVGIVGVADLDEICTRDTRLTHCCCGRWAMESSLCHWHLTNPRPFRQPVECRGRQGLWYPTGDTAELVQRQLAKVGAS